MRRRSFLSVLGSLFFGSLVRADDASDALATAKALRQAAASRKSPVAEPKVEEFPPQPAVLNKTVYFTRQPVGHTHSCGRCGTTWDHVANPGHTCLYCGTSQFVQDVPPRPVSMQRTELAAVGEPVQAAPASIPYSLPGSSSNCPGGNCPAPPATVRRGLFR